MMVARMKVIAMQPLKEDSRGKRRTVADALEVIREELGVDEMPGAEIRVSLLPLPSGEATAAVALICPDLDCCVSFPASWWFTAFPENCSRRHRFEISCLQEAKVGPDGSVVLTDGRCLRGVEMVPTHMPYELSLVEKRILSNVIKFTESYGCYRNLRDDCRSTCSRGFRTCGFWITAAFTRFRDAHSRQSRHILKLTIRS
jgi:hypothetical protein